MSSGYTSRLLLILVVSIQVDWLPFVYRADIDATGWRWLWEHVRQAILPSIVEATFAAIIGTPCVIQ